MTQPKSKPAEARPLRVLMLPPNKWGPSWRAFHPGEGPDPVELTRQFSALGIELELIDPGDRPWNPFSGQHPLFEGLDPVRAVRILAGRRDCDLVLACFESPTVPLLLLRRVAAFPPPIVMVDVGLAGGWAIRDRVLDFVIPRIDGIIVLGSNQVDYIRQRWQTNALVTFIHQHVDTAFYAPSPISEGGPILSVGEDVGRDFPTLISALDGLDAHLVIKSRRLTVAHPARPRIQTIAERLSPLAYRQLFVEARLVALPLTMTVNASGVGTLLEAMAMGKPIIVSDSPGIRDYVVPGETALVVPCGDSTAMRAAVQRLMADTQLASRLGEQARAFAVRHCSFAANAARTAEVLRHLIAARRSAASTAGQDFPIS